MAELMSHTIAVGLGIAAVVIMAAILNAIRADSEQGLVQAMAENACAQVKVAAEQLRSSSQPATIRLDLPAKIGGNPYTIAADDRSILISASSASHSCTAGTPYKLSGTAASGAVRLTLYGSTIAVSGA